MRLSTAAPSAILTIFSLPTPPPLGTTGSFLAFFVLLGIVSLSVSSAPLSRSLFFFARPIFVFLLCACVITTQLRKSMLWREKISDDKIACCCCTRTYSFRPGLCVSAKMESFCRKVAVIGAGGAGLACARHLSSYSHLYSVSVFERADEIGGTWLYTDRTETDHYGIPVHSSVPKSMR